MLDPDLSMAMANRLKQNGVLAAEKTEATVDIGGEDEKELLFFVTETQDEEATRLLAESVAPGYHFLT